MRIDHFQGPDPDVDDVYEFGGVDENGNHIKHPVHFTRALRVFHNYDNAIAEQQRLQALQDIKEVEYYISGAELVDDTSN